MIESVVGSGSTCGGGSGGEVGVVGEVGEGSSVGAVGVAQPGRRGRVRVGDLGEAGAQHVVVGVGGQQGVLEAEVGDVVAAGAGQALDEPVGTQPAQVVGHLPGGDVLGRGAEERRDQGAQLTVGEAVGQ